MHEHWEHKKKRSTSMSNPNIDRWYEPGRGNGALGGKLVGAGAGGFLMFYAEDHMRVAPGDGAPKDCPSCASASIMTAAPSSCAIEASPMQCVILAGGLGTRMWPEAQERAEDVVAGGWAALRRLAAALAGRRRHRFGRLLRGLPGLDDSGLRRRRQPMGAGRALRR